MDLKNTVNGMVVRCVWFPLSNSFCFAPVEGGLETTLRDPGGRRRRRCPTMGKQVGRRFCVTNSAPPGTALLCFYSSPVSRGSIRVFNLESTPICSFSHELRPTTPCYSLRALAAEVTRVTLEVGSQGKLGGQAAGVCAGCGSGVVELSPECEFSIGVCPRRGKCQRSGRTLAVTSILIVSFFCRSIRSSAFDRGRHHCCRTWRLDARDRDPSGE